MKKFLTLIIVVITCYSTMGQITWITTYEKKHGGVCITPNGYMHVTYAKRDDNSAWYFTIYKSDGSVYKENNIVIPANSYNPINTAYNANFKLLSIHNIYYNAIAINKIAFELTFETPSAPVEKVTYMFDEDGKFMSGLSGEAGVVVGDMMYWNTTRKEAGGYNIMLICKMNPFYTPTPPTPPVTTVTGVALDKNSVNMLVGGVITVGATVLPVTATNKNVTWKSSTGDVSIIPAGDRVVVTGVKLGSSDLTATTADGEKVATCKVNVVDKISASAVIGGYSSTKLYPNPTTGDFTVESDSPIKHIDMISSSGIVVSSLDAENSNSVRIPVNGLVKGIYYVVVDGETLKLVRQ